jgi:hypothetical protein
VDQRIDEESACLTPTTKTPNACSTRNDVSHTTRRRKCLSRRGSANGGKGAASSAVKVHFIAMIGATATMERICADNPSRPPPGLLGCGVHGTFARPI